MKSEARQFINYHSACFNSKQFVLVKEIRNMQIKLNLNIIKELCWSLIFVISFSNQMIAITAFIANVK